MFDVAIAGGGIVGLAIAMELTARWPRLRLIVLEKESTLGQHQTGRNSGVIHSGIYYRPGSRKAALCVAGAKWLVEFCRARGIRHELCGKLVVATTPAEMPALQALYERGVANGVPGLALVGSERIRELEPHARGVQALQVPSAGIVDYSAVARAFAEDVQARGGIIRTSARVDRCLRRGDGWIVTSTAGEVACRYLVSCTGLHGDRLARAAAGLRDVQIVPFRGEYYEVVPARRFLVRHMIYPVPHPALPFLGAHFTRSISGGLHAGPNAVLALKREGYRKWDISATDVAELVTFLGFWRMARRYGAAGLAEWYRSWNKQAFVRALQRLVPEIQPSDLVPAPAGVRAQAVDRHGALLDDFDLVERERALYVRNVPSPAATASLAIGRTIAGMIVSALDGGEER